MPTTIEDLAGELHEEIATHISDKTTLANASLVKSLWKDAYQRQLFKRIGLYPSRRVGLRALAAAPIDSLRKSTLLSYVQDVVLGLPGALVQLDPYSQTEMNEQYDLDFTGLLSSLTSLRKLTLNSVTLDWQNPSLEATREILQIFRIPTIREIYLFSSDWRAYFPLSILPHCPNIRTVALHDGLVNSHIPTRLEEFPVFEKNLDALHERPPKILRLDRLILSGSTPISHFASLTERVVVRVSGLDLHYMDNSKPAINQILRSVGRSITTLRIHITRFNGCPSSMKHIDVTALTALTRLEIIFNFDMPSSATIISHALEEWIQPLILALPSALSLKYLAIGFRLYILPISQVDLSILEQSWRTLDEGLSDELENLQELNLEVEVLDRYDLPNHVIHGDDCWVHQADSRHSSPKDLGPKFSRLIVQGTKISAWIFNFSPDTPINSFINSLLQRSFEV